MKAVDMNGRRNSGTGGNTKNKIALCEIITSKNGSQLFSSVTAAAREAHLLITGERCELNGWKALTFRNKQLCNIIDKFINPDGSFGAIYGTELKTTDDLPLSARIIPPMKFEDAPDDMNTYLPTNLKSIMASNRKLNYRDQNIKTSKNVKKHLNQIPHEIDQDQDIKELFSSSFITSASKKIKKKKIFRVKNKTNSNISRKTSKTLSLDPSDNKQLEEAQQYYPRYWNVKENQWKPIKYSFSAFDEDDLLLISSSFKTSE